MNYTIYAIGAIMIVVLVLILVVMALFISMPPKKEPALILRRKEYAGANEVV
jgi:hypothetical protein